MPGSCAAASRRAGGALLQPGNLVAASWRGRLRGASRHVRYANSLRAHAAALLDDADQLAALVFGGGADRCWPLPEREPHGDIYQGFGRLIAALDSSWTGRLGYVAWECGSAGGARLSGSISSSCAATGAMTISPMSRRARAARCRARRARPITTSSWRCPVFCGATRPPSGADIAAGLALTGISCSPSAGAAWAQPARGARPPRRPARAGWYHRR